MQTDVWIGWDPAEDGACQVAAASLLSSSGRIAQRVMLEDLRGRGWYTRPTRQVYGHLWDDRSEAPMSTEHAIGRFFLPLLCGFTGWALFVDGDVLFRSDVQRLFDRADPRYAVQVVQHPELPSLVGETKKDGALQLPYARKNWSSVCLWNCAHPANQALTLDVLNTWPGRDLHAFRWLTDAQIGRLPEGWNYLVNVSDPVPDPVHLAHFTQGVPSLPAHATDPYAHEWHAYVAQIDGVRR